MTLPIAIDNPCAVLPLLRGALYQLMSGQGRAQVRFGEQWVTYHAGNAKELRAEIRKLETICNSNGTENMRGRAVQVHGQNHGWPRGWR